jgi:hypothetical protein
MADKIKFVLDGCDISFVAEAPEDITLKQLLTQTDKIFPDWCACGICSIDRSGGFSDTDAAELVIDYESIKKVNDDVCCQIRENWKEVQH